MRDWNPPEMADIIVSELLGSFGDNELSPECLDGAQRLLKGIQKANANLEDTNVFSVGDFIRSLSSWF